MPRLFQEETFEVKGLENRVVEQLFVYTDCPEREGAAELVFLKPSARPWQKIFLDAGIGFWEEWDEPVFEAYEDAERIDYGARLGLIGARILAAAAVYDGPERGSRIVIQLSSGRLELRPTPAQELDADSEVIFVREARAE